MSEEYIRSSKACVYVLGGEESTANVYDFDGEYILDGGLEEKSVGFVGHLRNVAAILLSAPTRKNIGTAYAISEKDAHAPLISNVSGLKAVKPDSTGADMKKIQEASANLLAIKPPVFNAKYEPYILYQSVYKGILSLYVLAGDAKDGEAIAKALASGNENDVNKAASEHGTVGVLLWRPAEADKPITRVLVAGTCTFPRIHQALEKAARALPFLHSSHVTSKYAFVPPKAPSKESISTKTVAGRTAAAPPARGRPTPSAAVAPSRTARAPAAPKPVAPVRPSTSRPTPTTTAPVRAPIRSRPVTTSTNTSAATKKPTSSRPTAPAPAKPAEAPIQRKIVGKVQASKSQPAAKSSAPPKAATPSKSVPSQPAPIQKKPLVDSSVTPKPEVAPPAVVVDDHDDNDSIVFVGEFAAAEGTNGAKKDNSCDIVVIPPTPEPPKEEEAIQEEPKVNEEKDQEQPKVYPELPIENDVEPEIPPPIDAFKKDPEPKPSTPEPLPHHEDPKPEVVDDIPQKVPTPPPSPSNDIDDGVKPSAPPVEDNVVIVPKPSPQPDIAVDVDVATPYIPFVPNGPGGRQDGDLVRLDGEDGIAPGFEEPLIPQAPREDGTLADCGEEIPKLVKISMDTDKTTEDVVDAAVEELPRIPSEVTQLAQNLQELNINSANTTLHAEESLNNGTEEYVRKLSAQMIQDASLPFTSALASSIVSESPVNTEKPESADLINVSDEPIRNGHEEQAKEVSRNDLMQSRSSVVENGTTIKQVSGDSLLDDILNACVKESNEIDALRDVRHLQDRQANVYKGPKFTRSYYFDVATIPRNEKLETHLDELSLKEFVSKVRASNYILASKNISDAQLIGILDGKSSWSDSSFPSTVLPTHSTPTLTEFKQNKEAVLANSHLTFTLAVDRQRTTVSSAEGATDYSLARINLRDN